MSIFSFAHNRRGMALLNMVFIFIFIGVLVVAGAKMYSSMVARGKLNDTKGGLENQVKMIIAWAAKNGRLPTSGTEYISVFGGTAPLDAWGRPIAYVYDATLAATATGGLCGRTSTGLSDSGTNIAFALVSQGDDASFQTTVGGTLVTAAGPNPNSGLIANYQTDLYRAVPLEEMKSKAGCYGPTGGKLSILNNELPRVCVNANYNATVYAVGGAPAAGVNPYNWQMIVNPAAASWLIPNYAAFTVGPAALQLTGVAPNAYETRTVTFRVQDTDLAALNRYVERTYTVTTGYCNAAGKWFGDDATCGGGGCGAGGGGSGTPVQTTDLVANSASLDIVSNQPGGSNLMQIVNNMIEFGFNTDNGAACIWAPDNYELPGKTLRAFWNFCFNNADTNSASTDYADGYTFTLMQGSNPTSYCGTGSPRDSVTNPYFDCQYSGHFGEFLAYCGLPGQSVATEFDIYPSGARNDPSNNHVAIVKSTSTHSGPPLAGTYGDNTHGIGGNPPCDGTSTACISRRDSLTTPGDRWLEDGCNSAKNNHSVWVEVHSRCNADCTQCETNACTDTSYIKAWIDKVTVDQTGLCTGTCDGTATSDQTCSGVCNGTCNGTAITNGTCYNKYPFKDETATTPDLTYCANLDSALKQFKVGFTQATGARDQLGYISNLIVGSYGQCPQPEIAPTTLADGALTVPYAVQFAASGGDEPYTWTAINLPPGLTWKSSGETCTDANSSNTYTCDDQSPCICGTPTASGTYNTILVSVSDQCLDDVCTNTASQSLSLVVNPAPVHTYSIYNRTGAYLFYRDSRNACTRISNGQSYAMLNTDPAKTFWYSTNNSTRRGCSASTSLSISGQNAVNADTNNDRQVQVIKPSNTLQLSDYIICSSGIFQVFNNIGTGRPFSVASTSGTWCNPNSPAIGQEITDATHKLTTGGRILRYRTTGTSCSGRSNSISYSQAVAADVNGDCKVNFSSGNTATDR
jgi:hypothetical protein